jgi:hypothetical protein
MTPGGGVGLTLFPSMIKNRAEVFLVSSGLGLSGKLSEGVGHYSSFP